MELKNKWKWEIIFHRSVLNLFLISYLLIVIFLFFRKLCCVQWTQKELMVDMIILYIVLFLFFVLNKGFFKYLYFFWGKLRKKLKSKDYFKCVNFFSSLGAVAIAVPAGRIISLLIKNRESLVFCCLLVLLFLGLTFVIGVTIGFQLQLMVFKTKFRFYGIAFIIFISFLLQAISVLFFELSYTYKFNFSIVMYVYTFIMFFLTIIENAIFKKFNRVDFKNIKGA